MSEERKRFKNHVPEIKTFPEENEVEAFTVGRLLLLRDRQYGDAYFIDVTESLDPTTGEANEPETWHAVKDVMQEEITEKAEGWKLNNDVVVLVSGRYNTEHRVYVGPARADKNQEIPADLTSLIAIRAGYPRISTSVPMSFDGGSAAKQMLVEELRRAVEDLQKSGQNDFASSLLLPRG